MGILGAARRLSYRFSTRQIVQHEYFLGEGVETFHNQADLLSDEFQAAYASAVKDIGADYRIRQRMRLLAWAGIQASRTFPNLTIAEFGTGRGFSMLFLLSYLKLHNFNPRCLLFDTFASDLSDDSKARGARSAGRAFFADSLADVERRFQPFSECEIIMGSLPDVLNSMTLPKLGLVHVDLNDGEAEVATLNTVWDALEHGALLILDDFANRGRHWQRVIVEDFFSAQQIPILSTPQGQGLAIKV